MKTISIILFLTLAVSSLQAQRIKGSDTVLPVAQQTAERFMALNPDARVTVTGGGTGVGISALLDGTTDIAMASRPIKFSEKMKVKAAGKEVEEVTYAPYQMRQVSSLHLVVSDTIDYTYKSAHREELNALYAQKGMADDILIVRNGYLTDTSIANVALYDGDTWFTPAHPLLRGTKRSEFLDRQLIVEKDIPQICLKDYSHIMLFNAMIDWKHIILPINEKHLIL